VIGGAVCVEMSVEFRFLELMMKEIPGCYVVSVRYLFVGVDCDFCGGPLAFDIALILQAVGDHHNALFPGCLKLWSTLPPRNDPTGLGDSSMSLVGGGLQVHSVVYSFALCNHHNTNNNRV
jgi:hypothetical protein